MAEDKSKEDQIKELEEELRKTKYNKRSQHHIGLVKAKLARLKEKQRTRAAGGKKGEGFSIRKTGDGTVVLLGFPSVGKSTLLNGLTNAQSRVGHYEFTTLNVIPGLLKYKQAKIQILDVPGVVIGAASGKGRGKEIISVVRGADLIVILVDVFNQEQYKIILKEIYDAGIRLNQTLPNVKISKTSRGGIRVGSTVKLTWLDKRTIIDILREFKLTNADVIVREDITIDRLIDAIEANKVYMPSIVVVNKIDLATQKQLEKVKKQIKPDLLISADKQLHLEELREKIFQGLRLIRVYLKEMGKKPDLDEPLIMSEGSTLKDLCMKLHRDFVDKFRFARIWGKSVKFDSMRIKKLTHRLEDEDIVEVHLK